MKVMFKNNQFFANVKLPNLKNFTPIKNKLKKFSPDLIQFILVSVSVYIDLYFIIFFMMSINLKDILTIDPHKRLTSSELLEHNYFTNNGWSDEFDVKLKKLVDAQNAKFALKTSDIAISTQNSNNTNMTNAEKEANSIVITLPTTQLLNKNETIDENECPTNFPNRQENTMDTNKNLNNKPKEEDNKPKPLKMSKENTNMSIKNKTNNIEMTRENTRVSSASRTNKSQLKKDSQSKIFAFKF
jgi:hypothetical protein